MAERFLLDKRWWSHHRLMVSSMLPLFDGVFAVALTLLAFSLPQRLRDPHEVSIIFAAMFNYVLCGTTVLLYWYKFRRLIVLSRQLRLVQLLLGLLALLTLVVLPKLAALALKDGNGSIDFCVWAWNNSQIANISFLGSLFLFDGLCLLFALSLLRHPHLRRSDHRELTRAVQAQTLGFLVLLALALMELLLTWFDYEYVMVVPIILLVEEILVARQFG